MVRWPPRSTSLTLPVLLSHRLSKNLPLIDRLASRRFADPVLAEEAALFVLEKLQADESRQLQGYNGKSRFSSYLAVVTSRLLEDFSRQRFGRLRPPAWLQRLGSLWLSLYRLLCLQRHSLPEAVEIMVLHHSLARQRSEEMAQTILGKIPQCGQQQGSRSGLQAEEQAHPDPGPEQEKEETEQLQAMTLLYQLIMGKPTSSDSSAFFTALTSLDFQLSGQESLLLKLCFTENKKVSEASRLLGLTVHQAHGRLRRSLAKIRRTIDQAGLTTELQQLLQGQK